MAFPDLTTLYLPTAANAAAVGWGSTVRALLVAADPAIDASTTNTHSENRFSRLAFRPYVGASAVTQPANYGWAVSPTDMGSTAAAQRAFRAGVHTMTSRFSAFPGGSSNPVIHFSAFRVGPAPGRTRTLLSTGSSVATALGGTVSVALTLPEVIFAADESIQYSVESACTTGALAGQVSMDCGTSGIVYGSVPYRIDTPGLFTLSRTSGSATGSGAASGSVAKVLGAAGLSLGTSTAAAAVSSTAVMRGSAVGSALVTGDLSARALMQGFAQGASTVQASAARVLSTVGLVEIGGGGNAEPYPDGLLRRNPATGRTEAVRAGNGPLPPGALRRIVALP